MFKSKVSLAIYSVLFTSSCLLFQNCSQTGSFQSAGEVTFTSTGVVPDSPSASDPDLQHNEQATAVPSIPQTAPYYDSHFDYARCGGVAALFHPYFTNGQGLAGTDLILSAFGTYALHVKGQGLTLPANPPADADPRIFNSGARVNYIFVDGVLRAMNSVYNSYTPDLIQPYLAQGKVVCLLTTNPSKNIRHITAGQKTNLYCPRKDSTGFGLESAVMMVSVSYMSEARFPASTESAANNIGAVTCYNGARTDSSLVTLDQFRAAFAATLDIVPQ